MLNGVTSRMRQFREYLFPETITQTHDPEAALEVVALVTPSLNALEEISSNSAQRLTETNKEEESTRLVRFQQRIQNTWLGKWAQSQRPLIDLLKPYLRPNKENKRRILDLSLITFTSLGAGLSTIFVLQGLADLLTAAVQPELLLSDLTLAIVECVIAITANTVLSYTSGYITLKLSEDLYKAMSKDYIRKLDTIPVYGLDFVNPQNGDKKKEKNGDQAKEKKGKGSDQKKEKPKELNYAHILAEDIFEITNTSIVLGKSFLETLQDASIGVVLLLIYAPYTVLGALGVSTAVAFGMSRLHDVFMKNKKDGKLAKEGLLAQFKHVFQKANPITLKQGWLKERQSLTDKLEGEIGVSQTLYKKRIVTSKMNLIKKLSGNISQLLALGLTIPSIISGRVKIEQVTAMLAYVASVLAMGNWRQNNKSDLGSMDMAIDRVQKLNKLFDRSENLLRSNRITIGFDNGKQTPSNTSERTPSFGVSHLSLTTPKGEELFSDISFEIKPEKVTRIKAKSGFGKSTLFKALLGLWPFGKGDVILPVVDRNKPQVYLIPSPPYLPEDSTLLDAIYYPHDAATDQNTVEKVKKLMKSFNFDQKTIDQLQEKRDWNTLSDGEQQRIALLGAYLSEPDVLLIDEGMNKLDANTRNAVEGILKSLRHTTILAIDHNDNDNSFYDDLIDLNKLSSTKEEATTNNIKVLNNSK